MIQELIYYTVKCRTKLPVQRMPSARYDFHNGHLANYFGEIELGIRGGPDLHLHELSEQDTEPLSLLSYKYHLGSE